jgi:hypothetical protein
LKSIPDKGTEHSGRVLLAAGQPLTILHLPGTPDKSISQAIRCEMRPRLYLSADKARRMLRMSKRCFYCGSMVKREHIFLQANPTGSSFHYLKRKQPRVQVSYKVLEPKAGNKRQKRAPPTASVRWRESRRR